MKQPDIWKLKAAQDFADGDLKALTESLKETNKILVRITNSFYEDKVQFEFWKTHIEILLLKYSFHSSSFVQLLDGTTISDYDNKKIIVPDIPTLRILLRSIIENYLTVNYLFFEPKDNHKGEFRYYLYELSGMQARQDWNVERAEFAKQKEQERLEILKIEDLILNNEYYKSLEPNIQKSILKRKSAREEGWEKLIQKSDLKSYIFSSMWKLFSNTAHSELIGAIQFKGFISKDKKHLNDELVTNVFIALLINSSLITNLKDRHPTIEEVFKNIPEEISSKIEFWTKIARNQNVS